ncbi:MAG: hypothetical protein KAI47_05850, partial [Deltaproteobacteria bacterium]|nr:hypothetical protein [Deltaproteobacteria bacterium]
MSPAHLQIPSVAEAARRYRWHRRRPGYEPLVQRIRVPTGYGRVSLASKGYGRWLRHLPLLAFGKGVHSYRGAVILPPGAKGILAVVDLDVGKRDRQQCVDTIMRLRGEYLYGRGRANRVAFA